MSFDKNGYEIVNNVISEQTAEILSGALEIFRANLMFLDRVPHDDVKYHNDSQTENSFTWYGFHAFESLLIYVQPTIEQIVNKRLYPTYSYARIYYQNADLKKHIDRPSCQYSATVTLSIDKTPWEIFIENYDGNQSSVTLPIGSMLVYRGDKLPHWREPYIQSKQVQVFLHYVDSEGPFVEFKYDKRPMIGLSNCI